MPPASSHTPPAPEFDPSHLLAVSAEPLATGTGEQSSRDSHTPRSLFGEILDWMLAPLLLLWPMSIAVTYLVAQSIANGPFDRALESSAMVLAQQLRDVNGRTSLHLPMSAREILRADERDAVFYLVVGPRGEFISGDKELPLPIEDEPQQAGLVLFRDDRMNGQDIRVAYLNVAHAAGHEGQGVLIQVAETLEKRAQLANEIIKGVILPQFVILPLAVILVWFGLARGLAPLNALQHRIRSRKADDLSPIDERAAPQEITPLVASFNDLLLQLEQSVETQKQFIADAAHQLKTPLAGLRMQAELALREQSPEEVHRSLTQIAESSKRAAHLVQQLLALARTENLAGAGAPLVPLDLAELARETVKEWLPAAWNRKIDLGFEMPSARARIEGHALMLREMVSNLVDNAIRYTPEHGHVTVRIQGTPAGDGLVLDVEDTGPGIPPDERGKVIQRFYRILGSSTEGSGLGLAIVREIAQQHGATLEILDHVYSMEPRRCGTLIRITFPVAGPHEYA